MSASFLCGQKVFRLKPEGSAGHNPGSVGQEAPTVDEPLVFRAHLEFWRWAKWVSVLIRVEFSMGWNRK